MCSRDFCRLAGQLYGAGDELAHEHDRIEALAAARTQAARQHRQAHQPPPGIAPPAGESDVTVTALEATCPHCAQPVAVLLQQNTALLPLEAAGIPG